MKTILKGSGLILSSVMLPVVAFTLFIGLLSIGSEVLALTISSAAIAAIVKSN